MNWNEDERHEWRHPLIGLLAANRSRCKLTAALLAIARPRRPRDGVLPGESVRTAANGDGGDDVLRWTMNPLLRFLGTLVLVFAVIAATVVYTAAYDVSAKKHHSKFVGAIASTLMVRSVRAHARDTVPPAGMDFRNPAVLEEGAGHFEAMCRTCHGAPGRKPDPWELYPPAPDLADAVRDRPWSDPEIFWIIKNGIKDTGMSAFGGSHSDEDIWHLTALIRQFPTMKPEQYAELAKRAGAEIDAHSQSESHEHHHAPGSNETHQH